MDKPIATVINITASHKLNNRHSTLALLITVSLFVTWIGTRIWAPVHSTELARCMDAPTVPPQDANDLDVARFIMAENIAAADCRLVVHNYLPGENG